MCVSKISVTVETWYEQKQQLIKMEQTLTTLHLQVGH